MPELRAHNIGLSYPILDPIARGKTSRVNQAGVGAKLNSEKDKSVSVLRNVSFSLKDGDRLAIIGPNGAGKSSLLNVLAGIYLPDQGWVHADGRMSAVFNIGLGMRREATGYRNIELRCLMADLNAEATQRVISDVEKFSDLGEYLKLPVKLYSRGMALRLNFAMVTAMKADIVLMDEWIGAGDQNFRKRVIERMSDFVGSASIVVLASHNTRLLQRICSHALWINRGDVVAYGAAGDIIESYQQSDDAAPSSNKKGGSE